MELVPPSVLPRGNGRRRSRRPSWGVVLKFQFRRRWLMRAPTAAGVLIRGEVSGGPASTRTTRVMGSAESRFARTHPAVPAPMIRKSQEVGISFTKGKTGCLTVGHHENGFWAVGHLS